MPQWSLREILRLALIVLVVLQGVVWIQWGWLQTLKPAEPDRNVLTLGNTLLLDGLVILGAGGLLRRALLQKGQTRKILAKIRFGIEMYVTSLPVFVMLALGMAMVFRLFNYEAQPQEVFSLYLSEERTWVLSGLLLLVALVGPIAEELFFRGLLYGWLRSRMSVGRALGLTALLFAALHTHWVAFVPIFGLGLLLGWLYERTGSLAVPVVVHITHNAGMLYLASLAKMVAFT